MFYHQINAGFMAICNLAQNSCKKLYPLKRKPNLKLKWGSVWSTNRYPMIHQQTSF